MLSRSALACVLLAGASACDVVYGLSRPRDVVTGTLVRERLTNGPGGIPIVTETAFEGETVTLLAQYGEERVVIPYEPDGNFEIEVPDDAPSDRYRLHLSVDDRIAEIQAGELRLDFAFRALGRLQRVSPARLTTVSVPTPSAGIGFLVSTGLWSQTAASDPYTVDWRSAGSLEGPIGLLDARYDDILYYLDFEITPTNGYAIGGASILDALIMSDGSMTTVPPLVPVTRDRCARFVGPRAMFADRLLAAAGGTSPTYSWVLQAAPDLEVTSGLTFLAYEHAPSATDVDVTMMYANPIRGAEQLAGMTVATSIDVRYPGGVASNLKAYVASLAPVPTSPTCDSTIDLGSTVGIPGNFLLDGERIVVDLQMTSLDRTRAAVVTWELVGGGDADMYIAQLLEVQRDAMNITTTRTIRDYITLDRTLELDPDLLVGDGIYLVLVQAVSGVPGARDGSNRAISYPFATAQTYSRPFTIAR